MRWEKISPYEIRIWCEEYTVEVQNFGVGAFKIKYALIDNEYYQELNEYIQCPINVSMILSSDEESIEMSNGDFQCIFRDKHLSFFRGDQLILEELVRTKFDVRRTLGINDAIPIRKKYSSALEILPFSVISTGGKFRAALNFETGVNEKIIGIGGYPEVNLNKFGGVYELKQKNTQTSIPAYISNKGYGFIFCNPGIGRVTFGKNRYLWEQDNSKYIEYIVYVGNNPKELTQKLTSFIGRPPRFPNKYLGLWQSKLRYRTTEEILEIFENYKVKKIIPSVLVIDYFHWKHEGDYDFDYNYWHGIEEVAERLKSEGTELMVSVWPTISKNSSTYTALKDFGFLKSPVKQYALFGDSFILDVFNSYANKIVRDKLVNNYSGIGINLYWLDQAEPELMGDYYSEIMCKEGEFDKVANMYPVKYLEIVSESNSPILVRSGWFGSQKKGALLWSGDIDSSFRSLKEQVQVAISLGICGISWWTSDIAGFITGETNTEQFRELMIRWFQFSVFSPVLRMHGDRQPHFQPIGEGGGMRTSGSQNEIWSFGKSVEEILISQIKLRQQLVDYLSNIFEESSQYGYPIIRGLFFEFPNDKECWKEIQQYMLGDELLVCPVTEFNTHKLKIYLPKNFDWVDIFNNNLYKGGRYYVVDIDIKYIPVFCKKGGYFERNYLHKIQL